MPGSGSPAYAQGSTVSFNGVPVGELLSWDVTPANASVTDATSQDSTILGSGADARVVKQVDCVAVDPGTASITFLGSAGFVVNDTGMSGALAVTSDAGNVTLDAILVSFQITGAVGELIKGTANFQFTGND
jgi:hypothetical protein